MTVYLLDVSTKERESSQLDVVFHADHNGTKLRLDVEEARSSRRRRFLLDEMRSQPIVRHYLQHFSTLMRCSASDNARNMERLWIVRQDRGCRRLKSCGE